MPEKMSPINLVIGYGENLGSGFPMIMSAWKNAGWGEPVLENKVDIDEVELVQPLQEAHSKQNSENISGSPLSTKSQKTQRDYYGQSRFVKDFVKDFVKELSERQLFILEVIVQNPSLSAKTISEKVSEKMSEKVSEKKSVSDRTIQNDLAQLKKMGIIAREGGRKEGHWVILINQEDGNM